MEPEKKPTEGQEPEVTVQLTQETIDQIKSRVAESNPDKTDEDLSSVIEAEMTKELDKLKEEQKPYIEKYKEVIKRPEMAGKTEDEINAIIESELASGKEDAPASVDFDLFDTQTGEQKKTEPSKVELPEDVKATLAEYEQVKTDPLFDAYIKAKKTGSADFLDVIRREGLLIDVKSLPADDVFKADLMRLKALDPSITDESIEDELDAFRSLSNIEKVRRTAPIREQLIKEQEERAKRLGKVFDTRAKAEDPNKILEEFSTSAEKLKGSKFLYTQVGDEQISKAKGMVKNGLLSFRKQDGSIDHDAAAKAAFILSNFRSLVEDARKEAYLEGKRSEQKKNGNAKSPIKISASLPEHRGDTSGDYEALKKKAKEQGMSVIDYMNKYGKQ